MWWPAAVATDRVWVNGVTLAAVAVVFMGASRMAVAFHAMRGTNASWRSRANNCKGGGSLTPGTKRQREWKEGVEAEGCTGAARKPRGKVAGLQSTKGGE